MTPFCLLFQRAGSLESENGAPLGSSPPNSGRRRRNSDSFCEMEKPLERRRSISCTRVKQKVEVVDFSSKLGGKVVHCGRCIGKQHPLLFTFRLLF